MIYPFQGNRRTIATFDGRCPSLTDLHLSGETTLTKCNKQQSPPVARIAISLIIKILLYHPLLKLTGSFILQYHLFSAVVCHFLFYQVVVFIVVRIYAWLG